MFQFSYLPYFPTAIDKKINRIHIFNFATLKDQYIDNIQIRNRIQQLCEMYVDSNGEPSNQIAIAVIDDNYSFRPLSKEQIEDLHNYVLDIGENRRLKPAIFAAFFTFSVKLFEFADSNEVG